MYDPPPEYIASRGLITDMQDNTRRFYQMKRHPVERGWCGLLLCVMTLAFLIPSCALATWFECEITPGPDAPSVFASILPCRLPDDIAVAAMAAASQSRTNVALNIGLFRVCVGQLCADIDPPSVSDVWYNACRALLVVAVVFVAAAAAACIVSASCPGESGTIAAVLAVLCISIGLAVLVALELVLGFEAWSQSSSLKSSAATLRFGSAYWVSWGGFACVVLATLVICFWGIGTRRAAKANALARVAAKHAPQQLLTRDPPVWHASTRV